jgi:YebC/PmpR family DNA-binding regulatory protein
VDNITRAIKKGTGELEGIQYEEHTYEGYGPGGAAIFLEAMTDNKNRTVSEIRAALGKAGGNLGENGCVGWMFEKKGLITVKAEAKSEDELMELAIDAGADDLQTVDEQYEITTAVENFEAVRKALEDAGVAMELAEITRIPQNTVSIDEKKGKALLKLMDILDDHDDIQKAYSNFDISDEVMAAIIENS